MPTYPEAAGAAAVMREAKPCCMRLTMDSNCAAISPQDWVAAIPRASSNLAASRPYRVPAETAADRVPNTTPECQPRERSCPGRRAPGRRVAGLIAEDRAKQEATAGHLPGMRTGGD